MNLRKGFSTTLVVLIITFLMFNPSFSQVKKEERSSISGIIESIPEDFKFVVVKDMRVFITPNTKIVDEEGNILKANDLQPKLYVKIEVLRKSNSLFANKIVVKMPKGV
jgi:hypothetical protein